ncbi:MAG TPA: bifunctional oligoribonuclease/PAP phosphatase NrnA [Acidobacteriota bacterium]|nr:bifunctional oligoribonuclease/PAP phosphatase NrnA [Acidobacteriota bacterium]HMZ80769.1 bifunctional oligoribonuclease/PAP phosphatase NrnA [Acidobacteriota bacterium]HNB73883.1 bifunctional oligoribonuclease/PAP phosphatase NrnA [Acidobacteriota bacterium]HND20947.1 bifunctional oligoribonuclease/PAP phosphatase NrnA [Acidobacteriota bacterium]HNG94751.1 bifunctional oligoribonuclease/PAP phosphatase NrnA [Acidobacteriota bacterium]
MPKEKAQLTEINGNESSTPDRERPVKDAREARLIPEKMSSAKELMDLLAQHRGERHIVAIQNFPDPDAIASALAHQMLSAEFGITVDIVYDGFISHQENLALVQLLHIELLDYDENLDLGQYQASVFVDNQGTTTGLTGKLKEAGVKPLVIVDHHERQGIIEAPFTDLRKVGATATIYTEYLKDSPIAFEKSNPQHVRLATALMHAVRSETNGMIRARDADFWAAGYLSNFVDQSLLSAILNVKRSKRVIDVIKAALESRIVRDNYSIAGVGYVRYEDRDAIPQAADFLLTEENIHTAVVYGIITKEGEREVIIGSLRTSKVTLNPDTFLKSALGKDTQGNFYGGGKYEAGGFEIPIGFLSGTYDDEFMRAKWKIYDSMVKRKLFEKIGVENIQTNAHRSSNQERQNEE